MTEGQTLGEELVLQLPISPILLRLAVDLHVSVTGFDFIEHSGAERENKKHINDLKSKPSVSFPLS